MLRIAPAPDMTHLSGLMAEKPANLLIFVSGFAVDYFIERVKDPAVVVNSKLFAVGSATAAKLRQWTTQTVYTPAIETSEGLLALPQLQVEQVEEKNIVIVRGVGGRELLAEALQSRGACCRYWQLYQRVPVVEHSEEWFDQWKSQQINCIVITSVAILTTLLASLPPAAMLWLSEIQWVVASERIGEKVKAAGIAPQQIVNANGAGDEAILAQVKRLIEIKYGTTK